MTRRPNARKATVNPREEQIRQRIAEEAARIMATEGVRDFAVAKRKAVDHLGLGAQRSLPGNREIESALIAYQRLFRADSQPRRLRELREAACKAMGLLEPFRPRLVGPVLAGTADEHAPVNLHLFAETPEQVDLFLMDRQIPYELDERILRVRAERQERFPLYRFMAGNVVVELTVFPEKGLRQAPLSPVDGRPMERAPQSSREAQHREPDEILLG
jgi:hypothetical protein